MSVEYDLDNLTHDFSITPKGKRGICKALSPKPNFREMVKIMKDRAVVDRDHTLLQYKAMSDTEQGKLKDNGAYVPAYFKDGIRRNDNLVRRSAITLDLDELTPEQFEFYKSGKPKVWDWVHIAHSTRKHSRQFPRLRIVIPLKKSIPASLYEVVARYAACCVLQTKEESLDACDEVSYRPAQVAYFQTTCSDQRPVFIVNDHESGALEFLDAEAFLDEMGADTEDLSTWPYSPKRISKLVARSKRSENPLTKPGIVGAWCNYVDKQGGMEWVIKNVIPGVYVDPDPHSHKPRYTYAKGQGKHGAVIEDGGTFIYSNHSTDPLYGQNANAWDAPRVHLFGHLDVDKDGEPLIVEPHQSAKLPSHAAMDEWVRATYPEVLSAMTRELFDFEAMASEDEEAVSDRRRKAKRKAEARALIGDDDEDTEDAIDDGEWMSKLETNAKGEPVWSFQNAVTIIAHDERLNVFAYDEHAGVTKARRGFHSKKGRYPAVRLSRRYQRFGAPVQEIHYHIAKCIFTAPLGKRSNGYGFSAPGAYDIAAAIDTAARMRPFHPLKNIIEGERWDGKEHVETFLIRHLRLPDTRYHREVSKLLFLAGISRIYSPGSKFDHVVVLEGAQGGGKSTILRYLAMDDTFFAELKADVSDPQKVLEATEDAFIVEIAELASQKKSDADHFKLFISSQIDVARKAYDRAVTKKERGYLIVGTTNDDAYLKDQTGNRRFLPVKTPTSQKDPMDFDACKAEVPQAWAEALVLYRQMQEDLGLDKDEAPPLVMPKDLYEEMEAATKKRTVEDPIDVIADEVAKYVDAPVFLSSLLKDNEFLAADQDDIRVIRTRTNINDILDEHYGIKAGGRGAVGQLINDIAKALQRLGWERPDIRAPRVYDEDGTPHQPRYWLRKGWTREDLKKGWRPVEEKREPTRNRHLKTHDLI